MRDKEWQFGIGRMIRFEDTWLSDKIFDLGFETCGSEFGMRGFGQEACER